MADVFVYDTIQQAQRIQIVHVLKDILDDPRSNNHARYEDIVMALCREYGVEALVELNEVMMYGGRHYRFELEQFVKGPAAAVQVVDVIEMVLRKAATDYYVTDAKGKQLIGEINQRFREAGVGYEYRDRHFMRVDSQFLHREAVTPALSLLMEKAYTGAEQEFRSAHKHYREGNTKAAIIDCLKSFESTMKIIYTRRNWTFNSTDTAKRLIDILIEKGLIDSFWTSQFGALRSLLEGLATPRNKLAAHGQGNEVVDIPEHLSAYAIHMTASAIVFLVECEKKLSLP